MSETRNVRLRLPVPEGRIGEVVTVTTTRAEMLINARYATEAEDGVPARDARGAAPTQRPTPIRAGVTPVTELPDISADKADWEETAAGLGIDTEGKTKRQIVAEVKEATGN